MNNHIKNKNAFNDFQRSGKSKVFMKGGRVSESDISKLSPLARKIQRVIMSKRGENDEEKERKIEEKRRRNEERSKKSIEKDLAEQGQISLPKRAP